MQFVQYANGIPRRSSRVLVVAGRLYTCRLPWCHGRRTRQPRCRHRRGGAGGEKGLWNSYPPRYRLFRSLYQKLRHLPAGEQRYVLDALRTWAGAESVARPTNRTLSPEEVVRLAKGGLIEV